MNKQPRALLALLGATLLTLGVLVMPSGSAYATEGTKAISAKALTDHECDSSESHFVITQVEPESNAPASITVNWENGATQVVPLDKYTGKTAHYTTTSNLDSMVTSATTTIYEGWQGQFNYSHGPCGAPDTEVTPTQPSATQPNCDNPNKTVTPGSQPGVIWTPSGATVLKPGDSVTYVATPAEGYVFPPNSQTSWTFTNDFDASKECEEEPPPPTSVTPDKPSATQPNCDNPNKTVTPSNEEGVIWNPQGATVLKPGDSVTYTASPAEGYVFPEGAQTSWTFTNDFDPSKECEEEPPPPDDSCPPLSGSVKTTLADGSVVNGNIYTSKSDVYVSGSQLGDVTTVYIRVTDPSGSTVLSGVKQVSVTDGSFGPVQLPTFADTPNNGGEYKVWVSSSTDFENKCTKTDNFKVKGEEPPPPPTSVTPDKPGETTPDCQQPNKTVTPGSKPGVIWNPQGATVLKPGETVTYVATPAEGYTFPEGTQTSWTFTNTFDVKTCSTTTPTPTVTPTPTPTVTPTPPTPVTPTPTTPTEPPTTPTETPTPEIGTPTSTSVPSANPNPTPTSTPTFVPPSAGGGDWPTSGFGSSQDYSLIGLMSKLMALLGAALLLVALFAPRRRRVI